MAERSKVSGSRDQRWVQLGWYEEPMAHVAMATMCAQRAREYLDRMDAELVKARERLAELTDYPYRRR